MSKVERTQLLSQVAEELIKEKPQTKRLANHFNQLGIDPSLDLIDQMNLVLAELNKCKSIKTDQKKAGSDEKSL